MSQMPLKHWSNDNPKSVIALVHGLGEFCERYDWAARKFVENGYAVISRDLPGHGQNAKRRGHIRNFNEYLDAVESIFNEASRLYPDKPVILFGHSMGGLITVRYAQLRGLPKNVKAIVLSSPALQTSIRVPAGTVRTARLIAKVWPTMQLASRVAPEAVSRSPEIQSFYRTNEDILHKTSVKFMIEFLDAMDASISAPTKVEVPVFTMQAGEDRLVSVETTMKFHETLTSPHKDFKLYPQCYHELLNEPEREEVVQDVVTWLKAQGL